MALKYTASHNHPLFESTAKSISANIVDVKHPSIRSTTKICIKQLMKKEIHRNNHQHREVFSVSFLEVSYFRIIIENLVKLFDLIWWCSRCGSRTHFPKLGNLFGVGHFQTISILVCQEQLIFIVKEKKIYENQHLNLKYKHKYTTKHTYIDACIVRILRNTNNSHA